MNASMINLILWIPFLIAVVITGLIFMIGGYRKGLRRALVSLGATVIGAIVSILLAKVIVPLVTPTVSKSIPVEALFGEDIPVNLVSMFLDSIIQVVVTQVLFFLLLVFVTTICRILMGYFWGKKKVSSESEDEEMLVPEKSSKKWGGLGVGFANAMLFSLLLVLPLYGTIAAYVPAITKMYSLSAFDSGTSSNPDSNASSGMQDGFVQTEDELLALLEGISSHPAIQITGSGPVAGIYDSLSETKVNEATVNYSEMAETMEAIMTEVETLRAVETEEDLVEHSKELLTILREDVMEEEWAYELAKEVKGSLQDYMPQMDDESYAIINKVLDYVCNSKENFEEIGTKILDGFIKTLDEQDAEAEEDFVKLLADIMEDAGVNEN